ncbi:hypothetical protein SACC_17570 [Saccharolobus caldissimus]|uniref:Uncharacterized protein n=1 Tax=Saccharolobus caldissimus TaxID=1702097 RepID=A0AAQ4CSF9_9CREN|nr:hypothetical protein SACC_17570 [Saccharolobus caldissimus]
MISENISIYVDDSYIVFDQYIELIRYIYLFYANNFKSIQSKIDKYYIISKII